MSSLASLRLDKWLWAARFHKTRSLAVEDINRGRVQVNGQPAKPSRELHVGDRLDVRGHDGLVRTVRVLGLSSIRGPAPAAQALYEETPESLQRREQHAEQRRLAHEPAQAIEHGRPTKRDRRQLADWQRWSASSDEQGR
ncbi:MAG: RNA-binding S4 domain-containing protein [Aquabacterium sp.]|nr:MAG: RNA-binding S4 domain-containing protein [Aquabacterium sp.]